MDVLHNVENSLGLCQFKCILRHHFELIRFGAEPFSHNPGCLLGISGEDTSPIVYHIRHIALFLGLPIEVEGLMEKLKMVTFNQIEELKENGH